MESIALLATIIVISLAGIAAFLGYCTGRAVAGGDPLVIGIFIAISLALAAIVWIGMTPAVLIIPGTAFALVGAYGFASRR